MLSYLIWLDRLVLNLVPFAELYVCFCSLLLVLWCSSNSLRLIGYGIPKRFTSTPADVRLTGLHSQIYCLGFLVGPPQGLAGWSWPSKTTMDLTRWCKMVVSGEGCLVAKRSVRHDWRIRTDCWKSSINCSDCLPFGELMTTTVRLAVAALQKVDEHNGQVRRLSLHVWLSH